MSDNLKDAAESGFRKESRVRIMSNLKQLVLNAIKEYATGTSQAYERAKTSAYEAIDILESELSASQAREAALREKLSRLEYMLGTVSDVLYGGESAWADMELNEFGIHIRRAITDKLRYKEQAEAAIEAAQREANCQAALAGLYQQEVSKRIAAEAELRKLLEESKVPEDTALIEIVTQAHMAGQFNQSQRDPSYYEARVYYGEKQLSIRAMLAAAPQPPKEPEWTCAADELPAIGQRVILCINGVVQHETYIFDAADKSDFYIEYFWSRPELEEGLEISAGQFWMALPQPKEPKQ